MGLSAVAPTEGRFRNDLLLDANASDPNAVTKAAARTQAIRSLMLFGFIMW